MDEQQTKKTIDQLSGDQKNCLRLVMEMLSSKEIARQLNISPHVVDNRIKAACKILDASDRKQAARLLHDAELSANHKNQPLVNQRPAFEEPKLGSTVTGPAGERSPLTGGAGQETHEDLSLILDKQRTPARTIPPLMAPLEVDRKNQLSLGARTMIMALIALGCIAGFTLLVIVGERLSKAIYTIFS